MEFEMIRDFLVQQLGIDEDEITMESSFADDLGADSLDLVELIMALEEEYDIKIDDEEAETLKTVGDVVNFIKSF